MLRGGKHTKSILLFLVPKIMAFGNTLSFLFIAVGGKGESMWWQENRRDKQDQIRRYFSTNRGTGHFLRVSYKKQMITKERNKQDTLKVYLSEKCIYRKQLTLFYDMWPLILMYSGTRPVSLSRLLATYADTAYPLSTSPHVAYCDDVETMHISLIDILWDNISDPRSSVQ